MQAVVDTVNQSEGLRAAVEDTHGNEGGSLATAEQINRIVGVKGAVEGTDYSSGLARGMSANRSSPTAAELQVVVNMVNEDAGFGMVIADTHHSPATVSKINAIP